MTSETRPLLQGAAVHLWLAERGDPADDSVLGAEERARAARLQQPQDRALFVLAHAVLRELLARYTGEPAADLPLSAGQHGKPRLPPGSHDDLRFNLSHSGDAVLVALARGRDLGVDIEVVRPHDDLDAVAAQVFADDERAAIAAAGERRLDAFYALWTRKEACVKAWGRGLGIPLRAFSVLPSGGSGIVCPDDDAASRLSCRSVAMPAGYAAAVAVSGEPGDLVCRRWRAPA